MITNEEIIQGLDEITKFKAVCKTREIDCENLIEQIYEKIEDSKLDDKAIYIGESEIIDSEYFIIGEKKEIFIDETLTWDKEKAIEYFKDDYEEDINDIIDELFIELNEEEKSFIKLAIECGVKTLEVKYYG